MKYNLLFLLIFAIIPWQKIYSQSADVGTGCAPLEVNFTSPGGLVDWYWDFKDGVTSDLEEPSHIFTTPGVFVVTLTEGVGGTAVGEVTITIFEKPEINITSDTTSGCVPLAIQFTNQSANDPGITIEEYLWSFGDGGSSMIENPNYIYSNSGLFTVSLELTTNYPSCNNNTKVFTDYIDAKPIPSAFFTTFPNPPAACEPPLTVNFNNKTIDNPGNSYKWDFGNGQFSTEFQPGDITFEEGEYTVSLNVVDANGCSDSFYRRVSVGEPVIELSFPDTACYSGTGDLGVINFQCLSIVDSLIWSIDPGDGFIVSENDKPIISARFPDPGTKNVSLTVYKGGCSADTTFQIVIVKPDATFTGQTYFCNLPATQTFTAANDGYVQYIWYLRNGVTDTTSHTMTLDYDWEAHDMYYETSPSIVLDSLVVIDQFGCRNTGTLFDTICLVYAELEPDVAEGCAPLEVNFMQRSAYCEDVVESIWIFGDGEIETVSNTGEQTHVYENPGVYYAQLIITTAAGCVDSSYLTEIRVGGGIQPEFNFDKTELCLGDTLFFESPTNDTLIDGWHYETENGRSIGCDDGTNAYYVFSSEAGTHDISLTIEYNGCFTTETLVDAVQVNGPFADLSYMINCSTPFDVMFADSSLAADQITWNFGDGQTSSLSEVVHTYADTGVYTVVLEATSNSGCPASYDTAEVHIVDVQSRFTIPEFACVGTAIDMDATATIGAGEKCHYKYTWLIPGQRPFTTGQPVFNEAVVMHGLQEIQLVVEDINGCKDTSSQSIKTYMLEPDITADDHLICLPADVQFTDLSNSDTTITTWNWNFESTLQNPSHTFTSVGLDSLIIVTLEVENAAGCSGQATDTLEVYQPISHIIPTPDPPQLCEGDSINLTAPDFTDGGSFLHFNWDFANSQTSNLQTNTVEYSTSGNYIITLNVVEDVSGCEYTDVYSLEVQGYPDAAFSHDATEFCIPAIITFKDESISVSNHGSLWSFSDGESGNGNEYTKTFDQKGDATIQMVAITSHGCSDTTSQSITLIGPEGNFTMDKNSICVGDAVQFEIIDTVDVKTWTWDYGDGLTQEDVNPTTHTYNFHPVNDSTRVTLELYTEEGCKSTITKPLIIGQTPILNLEDTSICRGESIILNAGIPEEGVEYQWSPANLIISGSGTIVEVMPLETTTFTVFGISAGCSASDSALVTVEPLESCVKIDVPNIFTPNFDDFNDKFNIVFYPEDISGVFEVTKFKIFNRWGQKVYDNTNPEQGWDGRINGKDAPEEVYGYLIELTFIDGSKRKFHGDVTLLR
jgi:gliding motility-associated-like protein